MTILAWSVSSLLFLLSMLHVYWSVGGKGGMKAVVPEVKGKPLFIPTFFMTLIVAGLLFGTTLVVLEAFHILPTFLPAWIISLAI
jgi:hypothetical protein